METPEITIWNGPSFIGAIQTFFTKQYLAEEQRDGPDAHYRVRIHFENMLRLAHADRIVGKTVAAGPIPPETCQLWNRLESRNANVHLHDRRSSERGARERPGQNRQLRLLEDALDYVDDPGIAVLLTGSGAGCREGAGFHRTLG